MSGLCIVQVGNISRYYYITACDLNGTNGVPKMFNMLLIEGDEK